MQKHYWSYHTTLTLGHRFWTAKLLSFLNFYICIIYFLWGNYASVGFCAKCITKHHSLCLAVPLMRSCGHRVSPKAVSNWPCWMSRPIEPHLTVELWRNVKRSPNLIWLPQRRVRTNDFYALLIWWNNVLDVIVCDLIIRHFIS